MRGRVGGALGYYALARASAHAAPTSRKRRRRCCRYGWSYGLRSTLRGMAHRKVKHREAGTAPTFTLRPNARRTDRAPRRRRHASPCLTSWETMALLLIALRLLLVGVFAAAGIAKVTDRPVARQAAAFGVPTTLVPLVGLRHRAPSSLGATAALAPRCRRRRRDPGAARAGSRRRSRRPQWARMARGRSARWRAS